MAIIRRGALEFDLPDNVAIVEEPPVSRPRRRGASSTAPGPITPSDVAQAFAEQLSFVDAVPLQVTAPTTPRRRGEPVVVPSAVVRVDVAPDEHAVALVEQDGYYSWVEGTKEIQRKTRRGPSSSVVTFEIPLDAEAPAGPRAKRGVISDALFKPVTTIVFRFLARVAIGQFVKRLERSIDTGLVKIDQADASSWSKLSDASSLVLPTAQRARVLLLIHGTFSSTRGGFGSFIATDAGKSLIGRVVADYDLVLGFDHRTLSEDPLENAEELHSLLLSLSAGPGLDIDVITHSRGALVVRSLVEHLISADDKVTITNVVMVAGPNAGTLLASPSNWKTLVDLYTNLAVGICRLVSIAAPPAATVTTILRESLQAVAILVKAIVAEAADEHRVPGLAAMVPGGSFITEINRSQTPDHVVSTPYYAVSSDFEVKDLSGPQELPAKLIRLLGNGFVDQLMQQANDLVVDVNSMTSVDPATPGMIRKSFALGENPQTYHCSYFVNDSVLQAIEGWLLGPADLGEAPADGGASAAERREPTAGNEPEPTADYDPLLGEIVYQLPDFVATNLAVIDALSPVGLATRQVRSGDHDFAVVRSVDIAGQVMHYAFTPNEFMSLTADVSPEINLMQAGALPESDSPVTSSVRLVPYREPNTELPWTSRTVVLLDGTPIGVAPPEELGAKATPRRGDRTTGAGSGERIRDLEPAEPEEPPTVQAYFRAETDAEISTKEESLVLVDISLDALADAVGPSAQAKAAVISTDKPITVYVVPRINLRVIGDKYAKVSPPTRGEDRSLRFAVQGVRPGPGQLRVIAGQGPVDLVKLVLDVVVVDGATGNADRTEVAAGIPVMPDVAACDQLYIDDNDVVAVTADGRQTVVQTRLNVRYISESGDFNEHEETRLIDGNRLTYVTELYSRIEADWGASDYDARRFSRALKSYGGELFDQLLPEPIQRALWDNRNNTKQIQVTSMDPLIPWEIVHLKSPGGTVPREDLFLANMGLVRWIDGAQCAPRHVAVARGRADAIVPVYPAASGWSLPEPAEELSFLEETFGARQVDANEDTIMSLIDQPGQFDLLHFAGHGMASANDISNAGLILQVRLKGGTWEPVSLTSTTVAQNANLREGKGNRPLVFLNACQVGRAGYALTQVGGFAQAFLTRGAGIFVSTLWSVVDQPARVFTEKFYGELLAGKTVAEATVAARKKCRAAGDPTWLAYVVYGRPDGRLTFG